MFFLIFTFPLLNPILDRLSPKNAGVEFKEIFSYCLFADHFDQFNLLYSKFFQSSQACKPKFSK